MTKGTATTFRPDGDTAGTAALGERRTPPAQGAAARTSTLGQVRFLLCLGVLATANLLADLSVAPGVAGGMIHVALVLLAWWVRPVRHVFWVAVFASLLVGVGFGLRFGDTALEVAVLDRAIALLAIWGVAAVLIAAGRRHEALRRSEENLAARVREQAAELAVTQTHVELADRSRSEFFAKMGHELRTPLNAILGFSEIIKDEIFGPVGSARYRDYMHDINNSGHHLLDLINDLLDVAAIEVGKIELDEGSVEVAELVRDSVAGMGASAAAGGIELKTELPPDLARLRGDGRKVRKILDNLLSNAVKFTEPGGTVTVSVWASSDEGYVLRVADQGIGMALKDIPVALAPFGQVENELRQRHEGTGLGLPLSKALVELHSGAIDLQSEPGSGTTVTVRFPAERILAISQVA